MECLKFGYLTLVDRKGEMQSPGEFALHVQCPWHIVNASEIVIGSTDVYTPADEAADNDESFDWDKAGENLRDAKLKALLEQKLVVESVAADAYGGFSLGLSQGLTFTAFPAYSKKDEYTEFWRLINHRQRKAPHIVVGPSGIDEAF